MQDRFKFRFWYFNEVEEKWKLRFCDLMSVDGTCLPFNNGEGGAYTDWEHEFICEQCTGLKDKNGKLIYEGDILKDWINTTFIIVFDEEYAQFVAKDERGWFSDIRRGELDDCEIIGNIHENADLLGEE